MHYAIELKPRAVKDLRGIEKADAVRIADALARLQQDLQGDVKRLTNHTPEYRMRVGAYRVLFELVHHDTVVVYRVVHRKDAYR